MELANLLLISVLILLSTIPEIRSRNDDSDESRTTKPPPGFNLDTKLNPLENLILYQDKNGFRPGGSPTRLKRQIDSEKRKYEGITNKPPSPPASNPLEHLILHQGKGRSSGSSLSRVKRQYREYPYPYPIPIIIGGGFGGFGGFGRGFGGRGFGGRGFGGRGFGGRGFGGRGFGGRGFGGRGFGGRGIGGGIGGRGVGGGRGGGRG